MKKQLLSTAVVATVIAFTGCGGGTSSDSQTSSSVTGQFIDSAVSGLSYKCSSGAEGVTDVSGHFTCNTGDSVEFSLNGFVLGSATAGEIITPQTLFPNDTTAQTNLAQLLQTLDSDGDPENGITIDTNSQAAQGLNESVTVEFTQPDFDSVMTSYIGETLVDETNASAHLNMTLQNIENGAGTVTGYSLVAIVNNAADAQCHRDADAEYQGYASYQEFIQAGGSFNVEYFASTSKTCSEYSLAGDCIEQSIPEGYGGNGSCVMVVTFPESAGNTINDSNESTDTNSSSTVDQISYEDFTINYASFTNLRSDNVYISASVSYVGNTPEYTTINSLYDSTDAQAINFGNYYTIGGGNNLYEVTKTTVTINSDNPYTSEVTLQKEYTNSDGSVQDFGTKIYTEIDNLLAGNGTEIKFSKSLATSALQQIYSDYGMDISFDTNDRAWFMFSKWSNTDFELVMNESAYLKVKAAFQAKIAAANN